MPFYHVALIQFVLGDNWQQSSVALEHGLAVLLQQRLFRHADDGFKARQRAKGLWFQNAVTGNHRQACVDGIRQGFLGARGDNHHLIALRQSCPRLLPCRFSIRAQAQHNTAGVARQVILLTGRPGHFLITQVQRRWHIAKEWFESVLPTFRCRHVYFCQLVDELLRLASRNGLALTRRLLDHVTLDKAAHILRATGFWSSTRETFTTKGLGTDNGADLIAVNVGVAHLDTTVDELDTTIHPAVNTEGPAIALGINRIHYLIDVLRFKCRHVKHRAEDLLFHFLNATDLQNCG